MSWEAQGAAWKESRATGSDLLVLLALANYADENGESYPSIKTLSGLARMSERTVQRSLARLESMGEIKVIRGAGLPTQAGSTNRYRLLLDGCQVVTPGIGRGDKRDKGGVTNTTSRGDRLTPNPKEEPKEKNHKDAQGALFPPSSRDEKSGIHFVELLSDTEKANPLFITAWMSFNVHRRILKAPLSRLAAAMTLRKLQPFTIAEKIDTLEESIQNGWKGVFPKANGGGSHNPAPSKPIRPDGLPLDEQI